MPKEVTFGNHQEDMALSRSDFEIDRGAQFLWCSTQRRGGE